MKKTITGLAWLGLCRVAALAAPNWPMLLVTSPINLVLAYLRHRIGNVVETRSLPDLHLSFANGTPAVRRPATLCAVSNPDMAP